MDKEIVCGIYKITSPSGRVYIGESKNIYKRWKYYTFLNCKGQPRLYHSLKKYGPNKHIFEVIEECAIEELKCRERYWQDFYDVLNGGLNCTLTESGELKKVFSEESIEKIVKNNKGQKRSEETKEKLRKLQSGIKHPEWRNKIKSIAQGGKNHWAYGKKFSQETCDKKSKGMKEFYKNNPSPNNKAVLQYDLEMNFIKEWISTVQVERELGFKSSAIQSCARGKSKSSHNYIWKYKN